LWWNLKYCTGPCECCTLLWRFHFLISKMCLFPYPYRFCNPVWIYGKKYYDMIWYAWSNLHSKDRHRTRTPHIYSVQCFNLIISFKTLSHNGYRTSHLIVPQEWFQFHDTVFQNEHFWWVCKQVCQLASSIKEFYSDVVIKVSLFHVEGIEGRIWGANNAACRHVWR